METIYKKQSRSRLKLVGKSYRIDLGSLRFRSRFRFVDDRFLSAPL